MQSGITSYTQIPDEAVVEAYKDDAGYVLDTDRKILRILHNDNGYVYISYDDANVYII